MSTHTWGFRHSSHRPCLLCSRSPACCSLSSACWHSGAKYTQHFSCATSHKAAHIPGSGQCFRGLQIHHYPHFLCQQGGVLKIQKEPLQHLTQNQNINTAACMQSQQRCLHCITEFALPLHQFLKLTSSQQTQLKDTDTTLPWKGTGDQLWYAEIIWVRRQC